MQHTNPNPNPNPNPNEVSKLKCRIKIIAYINRYQERINQNDLEAPIKNKAMKKNTNSRDRLSWSEKGRWGVEQPGRKVTDTPEIPK